MILVSLSSVGQKVLTKEGMDIHLQTFYFASFNITPAFIFGICTDKIFSSNWKYIAYAISNGMLFYIANYFNTVCLRYIAIAKFQPITYLVIVFTFINSAIFLGEHVYFSDFIGALIIIGFQYYNFKNPPGKNISELPEKENNIKQ